MTQQASAGFAESLVDHRAESISIRNLAGKLFLRPRLFVFAFLVPPVIAMLLASMVPVDWSASTRILIRYGASDTSVLRDISPDIRLGLSGTTSAELIKSTPVIEKAIETVGITADDIYRKPMDVLRDRFTEPFRGKSESSGDAAVDRRIQLTGLARSFQESLESTAKRSTGTKGVEILDKPSQIPDSMKLDELISLEVRSFNRLKVAAMANGLARAYIDEYYRIYGEEAHHQYQYLDGLVADQERQLTAVQSATRADLSSGAVRSTSGKELVSRDIPILNSMAMQLLEVQRLLTRATQVYAPGAPEVRRLQNQAGELKFMLDRQERIEIAKQVLEQLKLRRFQAYNTETVYRDRLLPISIAEVATTPKPSSTRKLIKVAVSGAIATVLGLVFAASLMIILNAFDPRIHVRRDVETLVGLPVLGDFAAPAGRATATDVDGVAKDPAAERTVMQALTSLNHDPGANGVASIVVTAGSTGDGATHAAMAFALHLAKNRNKRVCLVDAHFADPRLSRDFGLRDKPGLVDAIRLGGAGLAESLRADLLRFDAAHGIWIVPAGHLAEPGTLGYYADAAKALVDALHGMFDYVVIDAGPVLASSEAIIFGKLADRTILVVSSGITRKGVLQATCDKLQALDIRVAGVLLNRSRRLLPGFIYRNVL